MSLSRSVCLIFGQLLYWYLFPPLRFRDTASTSEIQLSCLEITGITGEDFSQSLLHKEFCLPSFSWRVKEGNITKTEGRRKPVNIRLTKKGKKCRNKHSWIRTWGPNREAVVAFDNVFVGCLWLFSLTPPDLGMFISLRMTYSPTFLPAVSIADVPFGSDQTQQQKKKTIKNMTRKKKIQHPS